MKSELIVNVQSDEISIALTEDDRLMEVSTESKTEATFAVGNIYYGRVKKVMPALNAVFVDVGYEKEAFLHYLDLGPQFLTLEKFTQLAVQEKKRKILIQNVPTQREVGKQGSIADVCHVGQEILVQVTKEPINTKGPRLTAEISLAGRNIVLIPFGDKVMVSNKIRSEAERSRLKQLIQAIKPERFGVIVRTVAEGKRVAELDAELRLLVKRWDDMVAHLQKAKPISLVQEEIGRTIGVIRDVFTPEFESIHINDAQIYEEVKSYVSLIAPESEKNVHLYEGEQPIFDHFQITRQMKTGLGRTVGFKNGGYLIMERTEALFSIDVNSGSKKLGADQEDNAFRCNMLAADEIYHQLRLRDIGGIIIVDFIDMESAEHRQLLFEHMRTLMKRDRARHNVLQLSKFGLMQITRQRVRPVVEVDVQEECPTCHGKGKIQPSILFTDVLDEQCELYKTHFGSGLKLYVHPFVYAYANQGFFLTNLKAQWRRKYGVKLIADEALPMLSYRFVDKNGKKLELQRAAEQTTEQRADEKAKLYATKKIEEKPEVKLSLDSKNELSSSASKNESVSTSKNEAAQAPKNVSAPASKEKSVSKPVQEKPVKELPSMVVEAEELAATEVPATESIANEGVKKSRKRRKKKAAAVVQTEDVYLADDAKTEVVSMGNQAAVSEPKSVVATAEESVNTQPAELTKAKRKSGKSKAKTAVGKNHDSSVDSQGSVAEMVASVDAEVIVPAEPTTQKAKRAPKKKTKSSAQTEVNSSEGVVAADQSSANDGVNADVSTEEKAKAEKPVRKRSSRSKKAVDKTSLSASDAGEHVPAESAVTSDTVDNAN